MFPSVIRDSDIPVLKSSMTCNNSAPTSAPPILHSLIYVYRGHFIWSHEQEPDHPSLSLLVTVQM